MSKYCLYFTKSSKYLQNIFSFTQFSLKFPNLLKIYLEILPHSLIFFEKFFKIPPKFWRILLHFYHIKHIQEIFYETMVTFGRMFWSFRICYHSNLIFHVLICLLFVTLTRFFVFRLRKGLCRLHHNCSGTLLIMVCWYFNPPVTISLSDRPGHFF